jgi:hypothetical protein
VRGVSFFFQLFSTFYPFVPFQKTNLLTTEYVLHKALPKSFGMIAGLPAIELLWCACKKLNYLTLSKPTLQDDKGMPPLIVDDARPGTMKRVGRLGRDSAGRIIKKLALRCCFENASQFTGRCPTDWCDSHVANVWSQSEHHQSHGLAHL